MAIFKVKRGTDADRLTFSPQEGELIYTTDTKEMFVGDGSTAGGNAIGSGNSFTGSTDIVASGSGYKVLANGMYVYTNTAVSIGIGATKNVTLPIACAEGVVVMCGFTVSSGNNWLKYSSLSTTTLQIKNANAALATSGVWWLIAL